jgi:hypothetical protein
MDYAEKIGSMAARGAFGNVVVDFTSKQPRLAI